MRDLFCKGAWALLAGCVLVASPAVTSDLPSYDALRQLAVDGRVIEVSDVQLRRREFEFSFEAGRFHLLRAVDGVTFGAVFRGRGNYRLTPANEVERDYLALVTGDRDFEVLSDTFEEIVFLFSDGTELDLQSMGNVSEGPPDDRASRLYADFVDRQRGDLHVNFQLRLLSELVNRTGYEGGLFLGFVDGKEHPPALLAFDPLGFDALGITFGSSRERLVVVVEGERGGIWYSNDPPGYDSVRAPRWVDAQHYAIDTEIQNNTDLRGTAVVQLEVLVQQLRVLPLRLMPRLRLEEVAWRASGEETFKPASFIQEDAKEDPTPAIVFAEPITGNTKIELRVVYGGDRVLSDAGDDNYVVNARQSWYPNLGGFEDLATYELTYRVPKDLQVVSVGQEEASSIEGDQRVQVFRTAHPVRVAGFNYGQFEKIERQDEETGLRVEVYANPGTPQIIDQINQALGGAARGLSNAGRAPAVVSRRLSPAQSEAQFGRGFVGAIDPTQLSQSALISGMNAGRVATAFFGALPREDVAISQQSQWSFGQSWPGLIYMPYLAFLSSVHRQQLTNLNFGYLSDARIEQVGYHEFAHQWWGHLVGWESYRDVWLSEGFAEFTAALVAEMVDGVDAANQFWEASRDRILGHPRGSRVESYRAGPISLGSRLRTRTTPDGYGAVVYSKGAYVLHMLRMMLFDPRSQAPDARFIALMQDFTQSFAGEVASTEDFQQVVERHMIPEMNATGNGSMQWFFDQWVHGTDIPKLDENLEVKEVGRGEYALQGTVRQSEVPDDFYSLVPLYLDFGKGRVARVGSVPLVGSQPRKLDVPMSLPERPKKALVNARLDWLARK